MLPSSASPFIRFLSISSFNKRHTEWVCVWCVCERVSEWVCAEHLFKTAWKYKSSIRAICLSMQFADANDCDALSAHCVKPNGNGVQRARLCERKSMVWWRWRCWWLQPPASCSFGFCNLILIPPSLILFCHPPSPSMLAPFSKPTRENVVDLSCIHTHFKLMMLMATPFHHVSLSLVYSIYTDQHHELLHWTLFTHHLPFQTFPNAWIEKQKSAFIVVHVAIALIFTFAFVARNR